MDRKGKPPVTNRRYSLAAVQLPTFGSATGPSSPSGGDASSSHTGPAASSSTSDQANQSGFSASNIIGSISGLAQRRLSQFETSNEPLIPEFQIPKKRASLVPTQVTTRVYSDTSHLHYRSASVVSTGSLTSMDGVSNRSTSPGGSQLVTVTEESSKYEDRGMLEFSLTYDADAYTLQIALHRAIDLPPMDVNGLADPYVKLHLLPDASKATKKRSHTKSKTLNPVWNEFFAYHGVSPDETQSKVLRMSVFDEDSFGQNEFIGEARVELSQLKSRATQRFEVPLQKQVTLDLEDELASGDGVGKILVGILYMFKAQCLVVTIKRCAQLKSMDNNGYSDPYVKVYLRPDTCKETKRKTNVVKKSLNPDFNEEFTYPNIKISELANKTLEVTVWDNDFGLKNDYIGGLTLSMASKGEKLRHWLKMFKRPDIYFEQWHLLSKEPPNIVPLNMESMFHKKLSIAAGLTSPTEKEGHKNASTGGGGGGPSPPTSNTTAFNYFGTSSNHGAGGNNQNNYSSNSSLNHHSTSPTGQSSNQLAPNNSRNNPASPRHRRPSFNNLSQSIFQN